MSGRGEESDSDAPEELTTLQVRFIVFFSDQITVFFWAISDVVVVELIGFDCRELKKMRRLEKLNEKIRLGMLSS